MKKIFAIFIALLIIANFADDIFSQQYWLQYPSPTTKNLKKSLFFDNEYGWVIGDSGIILKTSNSGTNWLIQNSGVVWPELRDLTFISREEGWIISVDSTYKTFILHTTNSGASWQRTYFQDTTAILNTIYFLNAATGFISGFNGNIYKTTNSGASWNICYIDTTSCLYLFPKKDIYFINQLTGYACGGVLDIQGIAVKTTNGGASWFSYCVSAEPLNYIMNRGNDEVLMMGGDYDLGSIYAISTNAGANWVSRQTGCFGNAEAFAFRTPAEVWAALGFSGKFAVNLDSFKTGTEWQCIETPGLVEVTDVEFINPQLGFAFGEGGRIFKYNTAVIGLNSQHNQIPETNILYQNYPNPFNPETEIKFFIADAGSAELKIFDITGREVYSAQLGNLNKGEHSIKFNAAELPSAVYIYQIKINDVYLSKKMVLIK